jgi:hypothetical protein
LENSVIPAQAGIQADGLNPLAFAPAIAGIAKMTPSFDPVRITVLYAEGVTYL